MFRKVELMIFLLIAVGFIVLNKKLGEIVSSDNVKSAENSIVLDAGHGGADPGKVGINGVYEKDINLQVAKKVKELLEQQGINVIMTREMDEMLGGQMENTKSEDMKERVRIINEAKPELAVSIHQNSYSDTSVRGAQTFYYSQSEEGRDYAGIIQNALLDVDPDNHRQAKANDNYYLLTRTQVPTVIVECGFLSNYDEAEKLADDKYQEEISKAIVHGIESCFGN